LRLIVDHFECPDMSISLHNLFVYLDVLVNE